MCMKDLPNILINGFWYSLFGTVLRLQTQQRIVDMNIMHKTPNKMDKANDTVGRKSISFILREEDSFSIIKKFIFNFFLFSHTSCGSCHLPQ